MTFISLTIFAFVSFFVFKGILKGLIAEVLGMASVILSIAVAFLYFESFSKILNDYLSFIPYYLLPLVSLILLMALVYFSGILAIKLLTKMVDSLSLGWVNRILGGMVGFLKGALFVSLIILILSFVLPQPLYESIKRQHLAVRWFEPILPEIYKILNKKEFRFASPEYIKEWYQKMEKKNVIRDEAQLKPMEIYRPHEIDTGGNHSVS